MTTPRAETERFARLASWLTIALTGGCLVTSSEDIETSKIHAAIRAESSNDSSIEVVASLNENDASGTGVSLAEDDVLKATVGDRTQVLDGALSTYSVLFSDVTVTAETLVEVALERASKASAPGTVMTMPEPFEILSPPDTVTTLSRGSDLVVAWSPSGTARHMRVALTGDCVEEFSRELAADPGTLTIAQLDLQPRAGMSDVTCEATLKISRTSDGTIDPAFASGSTALAMQSRFRWFELMP